ncbi:hypothetical protein [Kaistia terrae]|uniref:Uncharacterized protein n=1 Tax=Kaistia terrae TaxID=537017 RepID=A0ABW0Q2W7_9HYPH|nr:hypothetical protein [Kaistia terrae]MCX5581485.1 hypothetical protein [Kaistia terrae]
MAGFVTPILGEGGHIAVQTDASGTGFAAFSAQQARQLTIVNDTGVGLEVRQGVETVYLPVPAGAIYTFYGIDRASRLSVRRTDLGTSQLTVKARWEL